MARPWQVFAVALLVALGGCGGAPYPKATESLRLLQMTKVDQPPAVGKDEAMLVFMRSSHGFAMVSVAVFDVSDETTRFIGIVNAGTKLPYRARAGTYTFMVIKVSALDASRGEADFMRAHLLLGRTYYAFVVPYTIFPGQAGFTLRPVRNDDAAGSEFAHAVEGTHFVATPQRIQNWAGGFEAEGRLRRAEWWPRWSNRPAKEQAARTLNAEDGRMEVQHGI